MRKWTLPTPRKKKLPASTELREHIERSSTEMDVAEVAIERMVKDFVERCREERKLARIQARKEAGESPSADERTSRVRTCPYILTYRLYGRTLDLYWAEVSYRKGQGDRPFFKRVNMPNGKTNMVPIVNRAAAAEQDVLRRHEAQARDLRTLWTAYAKARQVTAFLFSDLAEPAASE